MKNGLFLLVLLCAFFASGQSKSIHKYAKVEFLLQNDKAKDAYALLKELKAEVPETDTLYRYVAWYHTTVTTALENSARTSQLYDTSLAYGLEALRSIKENKTLFDNDFAAREYWMTKNIVVSYFGLDKFDEAKKYKDVLYEAYKHNALPDGIDGYFNFDFFKLGDKNIWGYEWYPELPDDRFSSSFTKVVYYVYSTNPDGSDKDQLYRFHVLMFHQDPTNASFDYILERQQEIDGRTVRVSYYDYLYKKEIDYKKLRNDITEIVKENIPPGTRRTEQKQ